MADEHVFGEVRVSRVSEARGPGAKLEDWFVDYTSEELEPHLPWLRPLFITEEGTRTVSSIHTWIVRTPTRTILIDTCAGNDKSRPTWPRFDRLDTPFMSRLADAGVNPEAVDMVFLTHLDIDHIGWNTRRHDDAWVPTFPNARYVMSRADHDALKEGAVAGTVDPSAAHSYFDSIAPIVEAGMVDFVNGDEDLGEGLSLALTPGHAPNQMRVDVDSRGERATFAADVLHNPLQVPLWRWRTVVCVEPDLAVQTRREVLEHCAETGSRLMTGHFASAEPGVISAAGDGFRIGFDQPPS
jgi:glyoxylase-like metal-dependent hydrolase (beta-lactamase superfamily II)